MLNSLRAKMRKHITLILYLEILTGVNLEATTVDEKLAFLRYRYTIQHSMTIKLTETQSHSAGHPGC
jgi:hypothetical protein